MTSPAALRDQGMAATEQAADPRLVRAVERYMSGCSRVGDCLIRDIKGYGWISIGRDHRWLAHRAVYMVKKGPIDEGQVIRHTCDTPQCVEPQHLIAGSQSQNVRDIFDRNRRVGAPGVQGEANRSAQLSDALVTELRQAVRTGASIRSAARSRGLEYSTVRSAVLGHSWTHVAEPPVPPSGRKGHPSPRTTPVEVAREARALRDGGLSLAEIGLRLGLNRVTVHRVLRRYEGSRAK